MLIHFKLSDVYAAVAVVDQHSLLFLQAARGKHVHEFFFLRPKKTDIF